MYAVSSHPGCTVINGDMAVDVPAGGQSVILALDKKLIIDGDDAAKFVEVRWGTNSAVGSRPAPSWIGDVVDGLISIVGVDKFDINYIPAENKLYLQFSLEVTTEQIAEVNSLLERVLSSNVVTEIFDVPIGFDKLEWIGNEGGAYIDSELYLNSDYEISTAFINNHTYAQGCIFGNEIARSVSSPALNLMMVNYNSVRFDYGTELKQQFMTQIGSGKRWIFETNKNIMNVSIPELNLNYSFSVVYSQFDCTKKHYIFSVDAQGHCIAKVRLLSLSGKVNEVPQFDFVPALDKEVGAPCLFDKVRRKVFYNVGADDFTYPGKEEEPTTYSLRKSRMYAQFTEHGIRRLYRVPEGYGSKEEYAEENGFKLLVETPMPEEGYWTPVWHDREDCIELEWVETEAPTEEELQIEEIENA